MGYEVHELLEFVRENDVKFIKLAFCDLLGNQKNISIMAEALPRAFKLGISFDASAIKGFMNVETSDLFLHPDPNTACILPWRPQHGRVMRLFCDIKYPDGRPFEGDSRFILKRATKKAKEMGYVCQIGSECEFYLFELDDRGKPTKKPHDFAGYCDIGPFDKGENVRREICLTLEEMGIIPESSHHEQGPGQNEIDFKYTEALSAADNLMTFKSVVQTVAARNGLFASFMPKPFENESGNGLHINLSLSKKGLNIFKTSPFEHSQEAESFIEGVLDRVKEITAFLNPLTNSYKRLGQYEAPAYITWSHQNRSQLIRIPAEKGEYSRMELRSPDASCNPYIAYALVIYAGLEGIKEKKVLRSPINSNLYTVSDEVTSKLQALPKDLLEALECMQQSTFLQSVLSSNVMAQYNEMKREEYGAYDLAKDKMALEDRLYFNGV